MEGSQGNSDSHIGVDDTEEWQERLFHLSQIALKGKKRDLVLQLRNLARECRSTNPEFADRLMALLRNAPVKGDSTRQIESSGIPLDGNSRLPLIRVLETPTLEIEPIYVSRVWGLLNQIVRERISASALAESGIDPTRTALFIGPPGVGKTLAAKWVARELKRPLAILDLSAVMSSFLGRTGNNLRAVLDFARSRECVLLLDELDAVAKRRDDVGEIGELKRLVTVLLQEIDEWPARGLLLAATNHSKLLDPAVWRRFELIVEFPLPERELIGSYVRNQMKFKKSDPWPELFAHALDGESLSQVRHVVDRVRRYTAIEDCSIEVGSVEILSQIARSAPTNMRRNLAIAIVSEGLMSQREASRTTGVSRDTIRKYVHEQSVSGR